MSFTKLIPAVFWPTTVVMMDDEESFLSSTVKRLNVINEVFKTTGFEDPEEGVAYVNRDEIKTEFAPYSKRLLALSESDEDEQEQQVYELHKLAHDKNKYDLLSTVIMDYNFPDHKLGLDYLKEIKQDYLCKILLTGYAKDIDVIDAFNDGVISKYLSKSDKDVSKKIKAYLCTLIYQFFENLTLDHIDSRSVLYSILSNENVVENFNQIFSEKSIKEFYLLDTSGSFLLIDREDKPLILAFTDARALDGYDLFFEGRNMDSKLAAEIKAHKKQPFFINNSAELDQWPKFCHDCENIPGTDFYFSVIEDVSGYHINC